MPAKTPSPASRGPRGSRHLDIEDIRRVEQLVRIAQDQNLPLNWMFTIRVPSDLCQARGKRYVHNATRALFQALRRRGSSAVAATIYERQRHTEHLHAHVLIHVPPRCTDLIKQRLAPPHLHVRQTDEKAVSYVTKQRWARCSGLPYEAGDYIPGPRISFTKDALALLRGEVLSIPQQKSDGLSRRFNNRPSPTAIRSKLRSTRLRHGLTQKVFYGLIGVSRAHGANVEAGRCRLSRNAAQRALQVMQELRQSKPSSLRRRSVAA